MKVRVRSTEVANRLTNTIDDAGVAWDGGCTYAMWTATWDESLREPEGGDRCFWVSGNPANLVVRRKPCTSG